MSGSQWAMPLAWLACTKHARLLAEGIISQITYNYWMTEKTDHAEKAGCHTLVALFCMVGIVRVCLTSRNKSRSSLFSWGWEPFALTSVCDSVAQQDMAEQSSMNFKKKTRKDRLHAMGLKWARRLSRSSAAGVVHARSCSTHRLKIFGRSSTPDGRTSMNSSSSESDSSSLDEDAGRWWKTCLK